MDCRHVTSADRARYAAAVAIAWVTAIALWPWLQTGNPWQQFRDALVHFANMPMAYEFPIGGNGSGPSPTLVLHPESAVARFPGAFLILLAVALVSAMAAAASLARRNATAWPFDRKAAVREADFGLALGSAGFSRRGLAVILPLGILIVQRATIYDGVRHVLFVIPMLALLAGVGLAATLPLLGRAPLAAALVGGTYAGVVVLHLARLHPLEYVAINAFAGGTREAYDKFEQDYWSAGPLPEGLRRLERRLDYETILSKSRNATEHPDLHPVARIGWSGRCCSGRGYSKPIRTRPISSSRHSVGVRGRRLSRPS